MAHLILAAANLSFADFPESVPSHETFRTSAKIPTSDDHRLIFAEFQNLDAVRDLAAEFGFRHSETGFLLDNEHSADHLAFFRGCKGIWPDVPALLARLPGLVQGLATSPGLVH
jgi:hypothetical protein